MLLSDIKNIGLKSGVAIAVDLGTTTIAAALIDITTVKVIAQKVGLNPQRAYGIDLVTRLGYAGSAAENLEELKSLTNKGLSSFISELLIAEEVPVETVVSVVIAGNTVMIHILLGLSVETLLRPPFRPLETSSYNLRTIELGWEFDLLLYVFPPPGGFVGGDLVAFLYGERADSAVEKGEKILFLDLGTNGEIALTNGKAVWATSAAAGPAFEGGNLSSGMAALPGAILKVSVDNERLNLKTVDDKSPVGICGSGVISLISTLLHEGVLDATGFLRHPEDVSSFLANHLREINNERHFVLYQDAYNSISLSQSDIRGVQLAKAGIRGGIEVLLQRSGVSWEDLSEVVITGSFGASLPPEDLAAIGMLPDAVLENTRFTENGVIKGAVSFITSAKGSEEVDSLACSLKVVPLSGTPVFERYFIQHMNF